MRQGVLVTSSARYGGHPYAADGEDCFDEAIDEAGVLRPHYAELLDATLGGADLEALARDVQAHVDASGCSFHGVETTAQFVVDPVPRIMPALEWEGLSRGLAQRLRAINAFLTDAYGTRDCVRDGVVPLAVIEGSEHFEPDLVGWKAPGGVWAHVAGLDIVRDATGELMVLEDNLRTPSGQAYMQIARSATHVHLPTPRPELVPRPLYTCVDHLRRALLAAAPDGPASDPFVVVLSDGRDNSAFWEHHWLARRLDVPLVELDDLETRAGRLWWRRRGRRDPRPVDVVYRRTDVDRLRAPDGRLTAIGEALLEPLLAGTVGVANAFGTGIADDKLAHAYVEDMVRYYLGEEPLVRSVPAYDLGRGTVLRECIGRIGDLVVKPRTGHGGQGIVIGPHARREDIERVRDAVLDAPSAFVAQELVMLSRHPTVVDGALRPRHVDLRPFVMCAHDAVAVLPGGLTRVAFGAGQLVVNSSQNGGAKDTWVLP